MPCPPVLECRLQLRLLRGGQHRDLVEHLATYDVVGFQTERDVAGMRDYLMVEKHGSIDQDGNGEAFGRKFAAKAFPISIETAGESSRLTFPNIDGPQAVADQIIDASHRIGVRGIMDDGEEIKR